MTQWDIHPTEVAGVLGATETAAKGFEEQITTLNAGLQSAASQTSSELVATALAEFATAQTGHLQFVFTRTGACLTGAAGATNAYVAGDEQMAANAQSAAYAAPGSAPPGTPRGALP